MAGDLDVLFCRTAFKHTQVPRRDLNVQGKRKTTHSNLNDRYSYANINKTVLTYAKNFPLKSQKTHQDDCVYRK